MTDIQPELWVSDVRGAISFYERAFGATVEHEVFNPADGDTVAQLSIGGARFWLASTSEDLRRLSPGEVGGATARFLLVVEDPAAVAEAATAAGANQTSPVGEEHGWLLGRIVDPFGHEWEIGRPPDR